MNGEEPEPEDRDTIRIDHPFKSEWWRRGHGRKVIAGLFLLSIILPPYTEATAAYHLGQLFGVVLWTWGLLAVWKYTARSAVVAGTAIRNALPSRS